MKRIIASPMNYIGGKMKALIINCSPVKNGATAEIIKIAEECIKGTSKNSKLKSFYEA